jgi:peptidyl-prolyl cis-trans isomerase B (cyclophilin B)
MVESLTRQAAPARAFDVIALVCAVVIAPVGLILGLIARSSAHAHGMAPNIVATSAVVIGAVITGFVVLLVAFPVLVSLLFVATG